MPVSMPSMPRPADVEKQDSDLPEGLGGGRRGGYRCDERGEPGAQRRDRGLENRITEHAPIGFEPLDGRFELLLF